MDELIDSKIKQDDWGRKHSGKRSKSEPTIHVSWDDRMLDELDDCDTDSDTDTDDGEDTHDDDESVFNSPLCRITSHPPVLNPEQAAEVGATIAVEETKQICSAVATLTLMAAEQASTELFPGFTTGDNFKLRAPPVKTMSRVPSIQTLTAPC